MMRAHELTLYASSAFGVGLTCILAVCLAASGGAASASRMLRVVRAVDSDVQNILVNPGFEQGVGQAAPGWSAWHAGYEPEDGAGRNGGRAIACASAGGGEQHGASQKVVFDQPVASPIVVRGWSKAENVSGAPDNGYSLYVDLRYADGTELWAQTTRFATGTHDWEQRELLIVPDKAVASLSLHCIFRGHTGKIWFDDVQLRQVTTAAGTALLDGVVVEAPNSVPRVNSDVALRTGTGLSLGYDRVTTQIASLGVGDQELSEPGVPSGFMVRDVAADSDWYGFTDGTSPELSVRLDVTASAKDTHIEFDGRLLDTTGKDRAVTLMFALPIAAHGWHWGESIRAEREIDDTGEYTNAVRIGTGATGTMSRYPLSCIVDTNGGLALGIDMAAPAQYRLACNAATRQYFIAYDFGLSPETAHLPSGAHFRFVLYRVSAEHGFRDAAKRYYDIFPNFFGCRSQDQGIWMPFTDVSTVEGWQDFGFRYHEGINNVPFDDGADILSFRYTEPSTFWMAMDKDTPRTYDAAMAQLRELASGDDTRKRRSAQAVLASGLHDEDGRFRMLFRDTPWCDGAVFGLSPLPGIPGEWTDAKVAWNDELKDRYYGPEAKGEQDGEYLDSLEGYVTANENFRREHFAAATLPLTFSTASKQPVIHKALAVYEFVRWMSDDVHGMGKLMMANSVPSRFSFLTGYLDVMGTETNWVRWGQWQPMGHGSMALRRTMCSQKPYLFLMNTDFDALEPFVERYFQRSLFYGFFPSMFSPEASSKSAYWRGPQWYNRDRELFKRYIPIVKRIAEAGWEPITHARADNEDFLIERFGPDDDGRVYFTVMNDGRGRGSATVYIGAKALSLAADIEARELVSARALPLTAADGTRQFEVELEPEEVACVELSD